MGLLRSELQSSVPLRRLLVIHNESTIGGAEAQLAELVKVLVAHPIEVFCLVGSQRVQAMLAPYAACTLLHMGSPAGRVKGFGILTIYDPRIRRMWAHVLRDMKPDAVLSTSLKESLLIARLGNVPVFWLLHSPLYRFLHRLIVRHYLPRSQSLRAYGVADTVVASLRNLPMKADSFPQKYVPSRCDESHVHHRGNSVLCLAYAGRVTQPKNVEFLVQALYELRKRGVNCRLLILGAGPHLAKVSRCVRRLRLEDHVSFRGWVDNVVCRLRDEAHVFCFPSRDPGEARPIALLEARDAGLPVVTLDVGDVRAMAEVDPLIHVVEGTDAKMFADAVQTALGNDHRLRALRASPLLVESSGQAVFGRLVAQILAAMQTPIITASNGKEGW